MYRVCILVTGFLLSTFYFLPYFRRVLSAIYVQKSAFLLFFSLQCSCRLSIKRAIIWRGVSTAVDALAKSCAAARLLDAASKRARAAMTTRRQQLSELDSVKEGASGTVDEDGGILFVEEGKTLADYQDQTPSDLVDILGAVRACMLDRSPQVAAAAWDAPA